MRMRLWFELTPSAFLRRPRWPMPVATADLARTTKDVPSPRAVTITRANAPQDNGVDRASSIDGSRSISSRT